MSILINKLKFVPKKVYQLSTSAQLCSGNEWGRGAGKGGGKGGTIRDAGGAFGKREAAHEEEYFRRLEKEQLKTLKNYLSEELTSHEDEISKHKAAIERHRERIEEIESIVKKY